jgi:hypothetical protein
MSGKPLLSDKAYNWLKTIVQLLLPASATLYLGLSGIWNLPHAQQIVGTITAIATFLGVLLRTSTKAYFKSDAAYDGQMVVFDSEKEDGTKLYSLELNGDPADLQAKKAISFKVVNS